MSKSSNPILSAIRALLPNIGWDAIKEVGRWFRQNPTAFIASFGLIGTVTTAVIQRLRGLPSDLLGVLIMSVVWFVIISVVYLVSRRKDKKGTPTDSLSSSATSKVVKGGEPSMTEALADISLTIRLREALEQNAKFQEYAFAHEIADYQAAKITDFVNIVRVGVYKDKLDDELPSVKCGLVIKNDSLFWISMDGDIEG